ncbi:MAG: Fic/DOC family N-terminal domain-containing protein [Candidatus Latescibacteria bacterium]|jgi:Fic family protein|nr:cell filamentation protein Fic [Gemmatimonadaceae bacterium]MDP6017159.1 Fic/DOC family N-terminal domain-containing protein [Candidatus Latescibacterota bacterium]MDP7449990.1 Fic/DOC family N-terminal domain-containing protein [Candidatus Latescibacterota bacterium]HJP31731.1 Fic/DOC family N-terminal domain-containing protein [Candidatus Latescibacterota bacterium]|tara:strand:- start:810 stop:1940 length:1131 start_codon:yes stop_codon:yes gene_type:complete
MTKPVSYHLGSFPPESLEWERVIPFIGPASSALARYDGLLSAIPNAAVLLSPLTTQEAVLSSRIEGTVATMGEVLEVEAGGEPEGMTDPKRGDIEEIVNYRHAMRMLVGELDQRRLSQHLLRQAHSILMQGVRGRDKSPGNYRTEQNWIGPRGCTIEDASFVSVAPEHLQAGMDRWEAFLLDNKQADRLVQLAIIHVEFEALHPFMDGNGRLGRMLVPLYLYERRLLTSPDFYMSEYLEANRETYVNRLRDVSATGDWTSWCTFFLEGLRLQAVENESKARAILDLYESIKEQVIGLTHSQHAIRAVDFMFMTPIFKGPDFVRGARIPRPTATRILALLRGGDAPLLRTVREGRGRRPGIFAFPQLLNVAEGRSVF